MYNVSSPLPTGGDPFQRVHPHSLLATSSCNDMRQSDTSKPQQPQLPDLKITSSASQAVREKNSVTILDPFIHEGQLPDRGLWPTQNATQQTETFASLRASRFGNEPKEKDYSHRAFIRCPSLDNTRRWFDPLSQRKYRKKQPVFPRTRIRYAQENEGQGDLVPECSLLANARYHGRNREEGTFKTRFGKGPAANAKLVHPSMHRD